MEKDTLEKSPIAEKEEQILKFWKENKIFKKSLEKDSSKGEYVFYDGPATANAKPVFHTMEPFAFKDIIPRYKTMQGFHVARKGGWDTHGLPVELQIEKKLGFKSKKDIEEYGIAAFNKLCKDSVWEYIELWKVFTARMGYWADQENPYVTYANSYIESVWNVVKTVEEKKLLYKDYKVLPWCPRCGTALSSHELAQGYQDDKDLSVYAKFKMVDAERNGYPNNTYFLAWTTTPWTLPGNIALAVGKEIKYGVFEKDGEFLVVACDLAGKLNLLESKMNVMGQALLGIQYEPIYPFMSEKFGEKNPEAFKKAYQVYAADFVYTETGTGIVHTAVMYGQDDFVLGTNIGLPKFHLVKDDGHFLDDMDFLSNRFVKEVDEKGKPTLAVDIIDDLKKRGLFFKQENITHSYPHCWRCKTPLIYYARDSWYIGMSKLRDELVKENEGIHWEPEHIREGRFGEWLREIKDWAVSRERYWGTPLPVWSDAEGNHRVVGSIGELKKLAKKSGNQYFVMRHGETEGNVKQIWSPDLATIDTLTENGITKIKENVKMLGDKSIDLILISPYGRTKETARIVADEIGLSSDAIVVDERLGEWNVGAEFSGKGIEDYFTIRNASSDRYQFKTADGESYAEVMRRSAEFFYDIEKKYSGKKILIVSHGAVTRALSLVADGFSFDTLFEHTRNFKNFLNAEIREIDFASLPHNENYELDLHRPFIDEVELVDEKGNSLTRTKEVLDVWFDSGSMPFAQNHYPFDAKEVLYPADYISEAIDQTRGWFYVLHAIGVLMGRGKAYKNVICLGHILDAQGKKMSKSLGNTVDPLLMINKYGADSLRFWMYSVNQPGDSKNFDEKTVDEIIKKVFNPLENILAFYELYKTDTIEPSDASKHILDRWIISKLNELVSLGTKSLENYKIFEATRAIREFANDFSTWYLRRSRDRFKSENAEEKNAALATTRFVFLELAKYMAPFTPFFAESAYMRVKTEKHPESVHLCDWPKAGKADQALLNDMQKVRDVVTIALELRQKAGHKVRQPLASLTLTEYFSEKLLDIIADEVNVKKVKKGESMTLDTEITPELLEEGKVRDAIRSVQEWRKENNLTPGEVVEYSVPESEKEFFARHAETIKKVTGVTF